MRENDALSARTMSRTAPCIAVLWFEKDLCFAGQYAFLDQGFQITSERRKHRVGRQCSRGPFTIKRRLLAVGVDRAPMRHSGRRHTWPSASRSETHCERINSSLLRLPVP